MRLAESTAAADRVRAVAGQQSRDGYRPKAEIDLEQLHGQKAAVHRSRWSAVGAQLY
jgi:hypothetical protein